MKRAGQVNVLLVSAMLAAAGCMAPPSRPVPEGRTPAGLPPGTTAREPMTHHALIRGSVVGAAGQALDSIQIVTRRLVESDRASLPANRAFSDGRGRFTVPVQAYVPRPGPGDTAQVHVVLAGIGLAMKYSAGGSVPVDSATVAVTLVPVAHTPSVYEVQIRVPVAPR